MTQSQQSFCSCGDTAEVHGNGSQRTLPNHSLPPPERTMAIFVVLFFLGVQQVTAINTDLPNQPLSRQNHHYEMVSGPIRPLDKRAMSAGSDCGGSEGQWNCMTNSWQRCAAGRWSEEIHCAAGTVCRPSGQTYEFHVEFSGSSAPAQTSQAAVGAGTTWWPRRSGGSWAAPGVILAALLFSIMLSR